MVYAESYLKSFSRKNSTYTISSRVLLENMIITQLIKRFPAIYGSWKFITKFTWGHNWILFWTRRINSTLSHHIFLRSISILSSHLWVGLPHALFPLPFLTMMLYTLLISPVCVTCCTHTILLDLITLIFGKEHKLWRSSLSSFLLDLALSQHNMPKEVAGLYTCFHCI